MDGIASGVVSVATASVGVVQVVGSILEVPDNLKNSENIQFP